jgi:outer membrane usher protein
MPLVGQRTLLAAYWFALMTPISTSVAFAQNVPLNAAESGAAAQADGEAAEMTLSVKDNGIKLGDAIVRIGRDNAMSIKRDSFLIAIREVFRQEALDAFSAALPSVGYLSLDEIRKAGLAISFNELDLELNIQPKVEQRPRGEIAGTIKNAESADGVVQPAGLSAFVNARFGLAYERDEGSPATWEYPAIMLEGASRWHGFVVEGEGFAETDGVFRRQATRLSYDLPEQAVRVTAGDLDLRPNGSFSVPPLLGVAIEKSYADLQPTRNIRPTSKRSFRLERSSEVQVLVNGVEARRLHLQPGEYDLNDLPLASGTNNIRLQIKDDFGKEETVDFSILFNRTLLAPGISEWSIAGGILAMPGLGTPLYAEDAPVFSATYRQGISENLTGAASAQASEQTTLLGIAALTQTPLGLTSIDLTASGTSESAFGWSAAAQLDVEAAQMWSSVNSAQLGLEIFSQDFVGALNQVPSEGSRLRVSGGIGQRLPADISASLSGYYQFADEELDEGFGASFSLSKAISDQWSVSLSGSYDHREGGGAADLAGMGLFARLNYRPDTDTSVTAEYDHTSHTASIGGGTNFRSGDQRASVNAAWEHTPATARDPAETLANGDFYYADTRIEVNATHGRSFDGLTSETTTRRTAVNAGMGVAFADGALAFGRPVRGGYAIVDVHKSLDQNKIKIDPFEDSFKAGSDGLGPMLVSDISTYSRASLPYEVDNPPAGYDVGTGAFEFFAPYKAGYKVLIGSEFSITASGILLDAKGKPAVLQACAVTASRYPDKRIDAFTNADGVFSVPGLKDGDWQLELNDDPSVKYTLHIPEDAGALVELGTLTPGS